MCTHMWPFPLSQALQAAHLHSLCLCRHRDPLSHAKPSLRMQLGAGQTLLQKQHNLLAQQQWKVSRLGRAGCSSSEAGGDWVLHRALDATEKKEQHGQHSSQTPGSAIVEVFLFSCLSPPIPQPSPPTALLKGHVTSKFFSLFSLHSQKQMQAQHLGWCWANRTGLLKEFPAFTTSLQNGRSGHSSPL